MNNIVLYCSCQSIIGNTSQVQGLQFIIKDKNQAPARQNIKSYKIDLDRPHLDSHNNFQGIIRLIYCNMHTTDETSSMIVYSKDKFIDDDCCVLQDKVYAIHFILEGRCEI